MPVRDKFPAAYFETNPLEGEDAHGAYKRLQWGNAPKNTWRIEAPEPMATLGRLAKLYFVDGKVKSFRDWQFFVAVGTRSNRVYFVPAHNKAPVDFPPDFMENCQPYKKIRRTDYYSEKGGEPGYYYHDHETPYPLLYECEGSHFILEPAKHRRGRSYAVNDEGIIG